MYPLQNLNLNIKKNPRQNPALCKVWVSCTTYVFILIYSSNFNKKVSENIEQDFLRFRAIFIFTDIALLYIKLLKNFQGLFQVSFL